jgi:hypothetical protein
MGYPQVNAFWRRAAMHDEQTLTRPSFHSGPKPAGDVDIWLIVPAQSNA